MQAIWSASLSELPAFSPRAFAQTRHSFFNGIDPLQLKIY